MNQQIPEGYEVRKLEANSWGIWLNGKWCNWRATKRAAVQFTVEDAALLSDYNG